MPLCVLSPASNTLLLGFSAHEFLHLIYPVSDASETL